MYDRVSVQDAQSATATVTTGLAATQIIPTSENDTLPELQYVPAKGTDHAHQNDPLLHPDLQELNFGPLGTSSNDLPAPLRPVTRPYHDSDHNVLRYDARGSLSDFSDYDSSEDHNPRERFSFQRKDRKDYLEASDGSDDDALGSRTSKPHAEGVDPFADPFADEAAPGGSRK